jgi:hypothetical protein
VTHEQVGTDAQHGRLLVTISGLPQGLPKARKRNRIPVATVLPGPLDLKTGVSEGASYALVSELVTVLRVNRFPSAEVKINLRVPDAHILLSRTLEVHLDPRLDGIPKHAMTELSGVKVGSQFPVQAMQDI